MFLYSKLSITGLTFKFLIYLSASYPFCKVYKVIRQLDVTYKGHPILLIYEAPRRAAFLSRTGHGDTMNFKTSHLINPFIQAPVYGVWVFMHTSCPCICIFLLNPHLFYVLLVYKLYVY